MKELDVNVNDFSPEHPTVPGKYMRLFDGSISLITVVAVPEESRFGTTWEPYLGVAEYRRSNITQLRGKFIKLKF